MEPLLDQCRRRMGRQFRKSLGMFNHKVKEFGVGKVRKPGLIDIKTKVSLMKKGDYHSLMRIKKLERESPNLYGSFTKFGNFKFDESKTLQFNVPSLYNFELKPYVSFHAPKINRHSLNRIKRMNDYTDPKNIERYSNYPQSAAQRLIDPLK